MARSRMKKKFKEVRKEFKAELYEMAKANSAIVVVIFETYTASRQRDHIHKIWELLGFYHPVAYKDYCDKLMGKTICGRDEILRSMSFIDFEFYKKYVRRLPESFAMGDALAIAYRIQKENKIKERE